MYHTVTLSDGEYLWGCQAAILRQCESGAANLRPHNNPAPEENVREGLRKNVTGALGELVLAKFLGRYPTGMFVFKAVDLTEVLPSGEIIRWEAKARPSHEYRGETASMILPPAKIVSAYRYVHITGAGPTFHVHGWMWGRDALTVPVRDIAQNGRPAVFVLAKLLTEFESTPYMAWLKAAG